tara:strand:+ start:144 stop:665 length:522 start_codon:yes stop_codon:yes gene_type:complete
MGEKSRKVELTDEKRAEMQSHYPYMGIELNELSTQEERLIHFFLRGMSKAAAGRAAGYSDSEHVYKIFKKPKIQKAVVYLRGELRDEIKFDRGVATNMYLEAHRKSVTATEECKITDSLCKLHGLHAPEHATQININIDKNIAQLERLPDSELLKIAGVDNQYLIPKNDNKKT